MERTIEINADKQILSVVETCDISDIVACTRNYLFVHFNFSPEWSDITDKTAIFTIPNHAPIKVILSEDKCKIPSEVTKSNIIFVGVIGGDLVTTNVVTLRQNNPGAYEGEPDSEDEYWYSQLMKEIKKLNGEIDPNAIEREVREYLEEHPVSVDLSDYVKKIDVDTLVSKYVDTAILGGVW